MSDVVRALELVRFVGDGRAELQEDALRAVLESNAARDRPVTIISVAGAYRRGKSFLLNFMIKYLRAKGASNWLGSKSEPLQGFNWSFGVNRVTTGILIWPEVFVVGDVAVILMDTQGTFDKETNMKENTAIVAFSALLSSVQIFNYHQRLDSQDLMNLEFFLKYGEVIQQHGNQSNFKVFQDLHFLIRDWNHDEEFDFGWQGGHYYLKDFITPKNGLENKDVTSANNMLNTCFNKVNCFLMPHPGDAVENSKNFQGQLKDIEGKFLSSLEILIKSILGMGNLTAKRIAGQKVTGHQLMKHIRSYVETFNSGELPEPKTMFNILADEVARALVKKSRDIYLNEMSEQSENITEDDILDVLHKHCHKEALACFDQGHKLGSKNHITTFRKMLEEQIQEEYKRFIERVTYKREFMNLKSKLSEQQMINETLRNDLNDMAEEIKRKQHYIDNQQQQIGEMQKQALEFSKTAQLQEENMTAMREQLSIMQEKNMQQAMKNHELENLIEENARKMKDMSARLEEEKKKGFFQSIGKALDAVCKVM